MLREKFGRAKRRTLITMLRTIVLQKFEENKFIDQLSKWEFVISEHKGLTSERLPEILQNNVGYLED